MIHKKSGNIPGDNGNRGRQKKVVLAAVGLVGAALTFTACSSDSDVVSENLSKAADQFEIDRRIVFYNGITDQYMLEITGKCSINDDGNQLEVTCKTGADEFKKHFLGKSDNVTYFAEHLEGTEASTDQYRVIFKPGAIVPNVDVE